VEDQVETSASELRHRIYNDGYIKLLDTSAAVCTSVKYNGVELVSVDSVTEKEQYHLQSILQ